MGEPGADLDRFARAKALFVQALPLGERERGELLERECAGDAELRTEVEDLLRHESASVGFLGDAGAPAQPPAWLQIPGFRILAVIDAGSSGYVFRAEQERPRREVAVKVLRLDLHLAPGMLARFQREAEILARLSHPGIAQVLGAGVAESAVGPLPWIAMELVRGRDLATHLAETRPSVRETVALFRALCEAVGHAHERGIVHRDLKPSNVLVDSAGRLRVIDFGIARTLQDSRESFERTRTGLVMGTLAYMAPEQARGDGADVGVQADVYALGAMLFEALAGRLPLAVDAIDVVEAVRIVREVEPLRLRALKPELEADLETILLVALEKDPARRYASAAALGDDLARWLGDRPVVARRPTLAYQVRKFVRRNRALTFAAAVLIASLSAGLLFTLQGLSTARAQRNARSELVDVLGGKFFDFVQRFGLGEQARPDMEEIAAIYERQVESDPTSRSLRLELARALQELGNLDQARNDHAAADARYAAALQLCETLAVEIPDDLGVQTRLSQLCAKRGEIARATGDLAAQDRWFAAALERDEGLVRLHPENLELREDLGWSLARVAAAADARGEREEALRLRLRRLHDAEELVRLEPDNWKYVSNLSSTHFDLAEMRADEPELLAMHVRENLRWAREFVRLRPEQRDALAWLAQSLGASHRHALQCGRTDEALAHAEESLAVTLGIVSRDPYRRENLMMLTDVVDEVSELIVDAGYGPEIGRLAERVRRVATVIGALGVHQELAHALEARAEALERSLGGAGELTAERSGASTD